MIYIHKGLMYCRAISLYSFVSNQMFCLTICLGNDVEYWNKNVHIFLVHLVHTLNIHKFWMSCFFGKSGYFRAQSCLDFVRCWQPHFHHAALTSSVKNQYMQKPEISVRTFLSQGTEMLHSIFDPVCSYLKSSPTLPLGQDLLLYIVSEWLKLEDNYLIKLRVTTN